MKKTIIKSHQKIVKNTIFAVMTSVALISCGGSSSSSDKDDETPITEAPSTAASATLSFDIKTFRFTWTDVNDATFYRLMENPDGSSGFTQVGSDITQGTQTVNHIVPLYNRVNASYILQSCNVIGCTDSSTVNITGALVDAIGYIKASNPGQDDLFGVSVSLSDDGTTLAVGAEAEDSDTTGIDATSNEMAINSGAAYVYTRSNSGWSQQAFIKASNTEAGDFFGVSISLSADGNTLAVGAFGEDSSTSGINSTPDNLTNASGAAYVYSRSGNTWSEQAYIKASNPGTADLFGFSVSLSDDGNALAVGAYTEDSSTTGINSTPNVLAASAGAAYVYSRSGNIWSEQVYIKASNTDGGDGFGYSVSLSGNGNTLAVGAFLEDSSTSGINSTPDNLAASAGAAYVYVFNGGTWSEQAYIKASNTGAIDTFGFAVSLNIDGNTLVVGAPSEDSSTGGINPLSDDLTTNAGAIYVYSRSSNIWTEQAYIKHSNPDVSDELGNSLSLSNDGNTLVVSTYLEDSNTSGINTTANELESGAGAIYMYRRNGNTWSEQSYIKASNPGPDDLFGYSVSLSGDGNTLAVGAESEDSSTSGINTTPNDSASQAGAVYLY